MGRRPITPLLDIHGPYPPGMRIINPYALATGGGFTPPASTIEWIDAGAQSYSDNDAVSSLVATIGGNAAQASGSLQPVFKDAIINAHPVIRSDGTNYMDGSLAYSGSVLTIMIVGSMANAGANFARLISLGVLGVEDYGSALYCNISRDNGNPAVRPERNFTTVSRSISYGTPFILSATFNGSTCVIRVSGQSSDSMVSTGSFGIAAFRLMAHVHSAGDFFAGDIAEYLLMASSDSADREAVENYWADRYAISL